MILKFYHALLCYIFCLILFISHIYLLFTYFYSFHIFPLILLFFFPYYIVMLNAFIKFYPFINFIFLFLLFNTMVTVCFNGIGRQDWKKIYTQVWSYDHIIFLPDQVTYFKNKWTGISKLKILWNVLEKIRLDLWFKLLLLYLLLNTLYKIELAYGGNLS